MEQLVEEWAINTNIFIKKAVRMSKYGICIFTVFLCLY